jgi:hypothetical protein
MEVKSPRKTIAGLGATVLATLGVIATAGPAAAASCSGSSCAGHDPVVYNCPVAAIDKKVEDVYDQGGSWIASVSNNYSATCNANFTRGQLTTLAAEAGDSIVIEAATKFGPSEDVFYPSNYNNSGRASEPWNGTYYSGTAVAWTDMVDGTNQVWSTITVYDRNHNRIASLPVVQ